MVFKHLIVFSGLFLTIEVNGQNQAKWKDLILKVSNLDEQSVLNINHQLACFPGLHFSGYVKDANCILLKYDPSKITDPDIICTTICYLNNRLAVAEVKGHTMYEIIDGKMK